MTKLPGPVWAPVLRHSSSQPFTLSPVFEHLACHTSDEPRANLPIVEVGREGLRVGSDLPGGSIGRVGSEGCSGLVCNPLSCALPPTVRPPPHPGAVRMCLFSLGSAPGPYPFPSVTDQPLVLGLLGTKVMGVCVSPRCASSFWVPRAVVCVCVLLAKLTLHLSVSAPERSQRFLS